MGLLGCGDSSATMQPGVCWWQRAVSSAGGCAVWESHSSEHALLSHTDAFSFVVFFPPLLSCRFVNQESLSFGLISSRMD